MVDDLILTGKPFLEGSKNYGSKTIPIHGRASLHPRLIFGRVLQPPPRCRRVPVGGHRAHSHAGGGFPRKASQSPSPEHHGSRDSTGKASVLEPSAPSAMVITCYYNKMPPWYDSRRGAGRIIFHASPRLMLWSVIRFRVFWNKAFRSNSPLNHPGLPNPDLDVISSWL